jgi:hypothetical protein
MSRADFPVRFTGTLEIDQPVYLFDGAVDWMHRRVTHVVGGRPPAKSPTAFRASVADALTQIRSVALDGAIACTGDEYVVYWEVAAAVATGADEAPTGVPALQDVVDWHHVFTPTPTSLPIELWDEWSRMEVRSGSSFNMQFERRPRSAPE